MNKIKKLKLNQLSYSELERRELARLQGGNYCAYSYANNSANTGGGLCSSNGDTPASFLKNTTGWGQYC
jgi:natural product precursor